MTNPYFLAKGAHPAGSGQRCSMEWISWIAGEDHTDSPACVSPILAGFCRNLNDVLDDETRARPQRCRYTATSTAASAGDETRGYLCLDWIVRTYTPTWLGPVVREAREKAAAAWAAARDADAARAAAGDAARDAAWAAAGAAAGAAAWDAVASTVKELQVSAFDLLDRMLPKVTIDLPAEQSARAVEVCRAAVS